MNSDGHAWQWDIPLAMKVMVWPHAQPAAVAILEVKSRGGQSSRMNVGLHQICWHNKKHNGLVYYASIMLAYWVDNIKI